MTIYFNKDTESISISKRKLEILAQHYKQIADVLSSKEVKEVIENNVVSYTYYIVNGMFKDEQETTIKLEILNSGLSNEVIETIKTVFNQECIMDLTLPLYKSGMGLFR